MSSMYRLCCCNNLVFNNFSMYLCGGDDVVLCTEVDAVLGLLHPANHGARQVDSPAQI